VCQQGTRLTNSILKLTVVRAVPSDFGFYIWHKMYVRADGLGGNTPSPPSSIPHRSVCRFLFSQTRMFTSTKDIATGMLRIPAPLMVTYKCRPLTIRLIFLLTQFALLWVLPTQLWVVHPCQVWAEATKVGTDHICSHWTNTSFLLQWPQFTGYLVGC
jgi:hypothetical protein